MGVERFNVTLEASSVRLVKSALAIASNCMPTPANAWASEVDCRQETGRFWVKSHGP